jgi:hypothetical protein
LRDGKNPAPEVEVSWFERCWLVFLPWRFVVLDFEILSRGFILFLFVGELAPV